ncbi:methyltransferase family protein [Candidatus Neomarinimicrobiota bacterium]
MKNNKLTRHDERKDLVGEHSFGDLGQLLLFMTFLIVWITDSFLFKYSTMLLDKTPIIIRLMIGLPLLFIAFYTIKKGLGVVFGEEREKPEIIEIGVFNTVRHPIYLGCILFYLGLIILTFSIASLVVWIIIVIFYYYISKYEEKLLLKAFGTKYESYMKRVPMLIPSILRKSNKAK